MMSTSAAVAHPSGPAPTLGTFPTATDDVDAHVARMLTFSPHTALFNATGQPAITLPLSVDPDGLPIGIQLAAGHGGDGLLLQFAGQAERATPWRERWPAVFLWLERVTVSGAVVNFLGSAFRSLFEARSGRKSRSDE